MASVYRCEPLITATRMTAATNLAILRTQAAKKRYELTSKQVTAAIIMAVELDRVVNEHVPGRTTQ
jgi:hypothetical protein